MDIQRFFVLAGLALTAACGSVATLQGERLRRGSSEFRAYLEAVFRDQNRAAVELSFELDDPGLGGERLERLEAADAALLAACSDLNRVAVRRREGKAAGLRRGSRAADQAPDCERAVRDAFDLLGLD